MQLPVVPDGGGTGQGANSQLGPVRPTYVPSGHIFASAVQAIDPPPPPIIGAGTGTGGGTLPPGAVGDDSPGQEANSQLGPMRPTDEPSGQTFASIGQAMSPGKSGVFLGAVITEMTTQAKSRAKKDAMIKRMVFSFVSMMFLLHHFLKWLSN